MLARPRLRHPAACLRVVGRQARYSAASAAAQHESYDEVLFDRGEGWKEWQQEKTVRKLNLPRSAVVVLPAPSNVHPAKLRGPLRAAAIQTRNGMMAVLDACLNYDDLSRATQIVNRLHKVVAKDDPLALTLYNRYLGSLVGKGVTELSEYKSIRSWFDKMENIYHVRGNAESFALLLIAALSLPRDSGQGLVQSLMMDWRDRRGSPGQLLAEPSLGSKSQTIASICHITKADLPPQQYHLLERTPESKLQSRLNPLEDVPLVAPTKSTGPGLQLLKKSLRSLIDADEVFGNGEISDIARQRALEEDALSSAMDRWRHDHEDMLNRGGLSVKGLNAMLWEWHSCLVTLINEELQRIQSLEGMSTKDVQKMNRSKPKWSNRTEDAEEMGPAEQPSFQAGIPPDSLEAACERLQYGPFLRLVKSEKLSAITILELIKLHSTGGVADGMRTARAVVTIGRSAELEYQSEQLKKGRDHMSELANLQRPIHSERQLNQTLRQVRAEARRHNNKGPSNTWRAPWPREIQAKVGAVLISMLMHVAKVTANAIHPETGETATRDMPAFHHTYQYIKGQKVGVIKLHETLMKKLSSEPLKGNLRPRLLPMVAPARPWLRHDDGGYYYTKTSVMRTKDAAEQVQYLQEACRRGNLDQLYASLDVLGQTAWKINRKIFDVMINVWNRGEEFAGIPAHATDPEFPPRPSGDADVATRTEYARQCREIVYHHKNAHSQRCDVNYKIEIARAFLNTRMYFPHNIDFRGRAYTIPLHLNHIGSDLCRGLLQFHQGKALGEKGLRWLKIHLASLCGYDKASFAEREEFAMANLENIYDSVRNPLDGERWWAQMDDPWQCLASCYELVAALDSPDPTKYVSCLPLYQDGTCNGLQHYAALGGDLAGAKQVNLEPSDRPQDVYTGVALAVSEVIEKEAAEGIIQAQKLRGKVTRKVVKQTVMTNVYGVTYVGARNQISNQLKNRADIDKEDVYGLSSYLASKVFVALRSMFSGAHKIQKWLAECAKLISKSADPARASNELMSSVTWTTPLGLPVVQPYRKTSQKQIVTNLQTVFLSDPSAIKEVNSKKQCTAFPPNFIHSLDATHMMMSALACSEANIAFAAVHDSYWTHACDIDTMNDVLREAFIKLHSEDIMGRLREEFLERYRGFKTLVSVPVDSAEGKLILQKRKERKVQKGREMTAKEELVELAELEEADGDESGESLVQSIAEEEMGEGHLPGMDSIGFTEPVTATKRTKKLTAWFDIEFPPLPPRGEFDVKQLKKSEYFFS